MVYVRCPIIFQHLLTFIRTWAQHVGLYGQVYGYFGGYSWAILCAYVCHQSFSTVQDHYSLDDFFRLVQQFFSIYSHFDWSHCSLSLRAVSDRYRDQLEQLEYLNHGAITIHCPTPPFSNSARSTIRSTVQLVVEAFQCGASLLTPANASSLRSLLDQSSIFPHARIRSALELRLSAKNTAELDAWLGWLRSRLARFLTDCENDCQLFVQSQPKMECRENELQRFYSIGFSTDANTLAKDRAFYHCLDDFLRQFHTCPYRTSTMLLSYKLIPMSNRTVSSK